jgi:hypothetical protein
MKTKIVKIVIMLTVSLFLSAGVSMANDKYGKQFKSYGKAYGYHKYQKGHGHHPGWHKKPHKPHHPGHRHKHRYHKRCPHHDGFFFGLSFIDPFMAVVVGAKGY